MAKKNIQKLESDIILLAIIGIVLLSVVLFVIPWSSDNQPQGERVGIFQISGADVDPNFYGELIISPFRRAKNGNEQFVSTWISDESGIKEITATIKHGSVIIDKNNLNLVEGDEFDGRWQGSWILKDLKPGIAVDLILEAVNNNGETANLDMYFYVKERFSLINKVFAVTECFPYGNIGGNSSLTSCALQLNKRFGVDQGDISIQGTVVIEQGSTLVFEPGFSIFIGNHPSYKIVKEGTNTKGVVLKSNVDIPTGTLSAIGKTKTSITLSYSFVDGINTSLFRDGVWVVTLGSGNKSGSYNDTGLNPGVTYTYALKNGTVALATTLDTTTDTTDAPQPNGVLNFNSATQNSISIDYDFDECGPSVYIFRDNTRAKSVGGGSGSDTWTDTGRSPGTTYTYTLTNGTVKNNDTILHWMDASTEAPAAQCTSGDCCTSAGTFRPSSYVCATWTETDYQCAGASCGNDAQKRTRTVTQKCTGNDASCTGTPTGTWPSWGLNVNCASDQKCSSDNENYSECNDDASCVTASGDCNNNNDCSDGNPCTTDTCNLPGTASSYCTWPNNFSCGDGVCSCGETESNCPSDCDTGGGEDWICNPCVTTAPFSTPYMFITGASVNWVAHYITGPVAWTGACTGSGVTSGTNNTCTKSFSSPGKYEAHATINSESHYQEAGVCNANIGTSCNAASSLSNNTAKDYLCTNNNSSHFHKITVPTGETCDLTWELYTPLYPFGGWTGAAVANPGYTIYTQTNGNCPSTSSYNCAQTVKRNGTNTQTCTISGAVPDTYYALVKFDNWGSAFEGPPTYYRIKASTSNCSSGATSRKIAFVTSSSYTGNLGGVSGSNSKCAAAASAGGLSGTFKAWISTSASSPSSSFVKSANGYEDVNGTKVVDSWSDLIDGNIDTRLRRDEYGSIIDSILIGQPVWTGTNINGTAASKTCMNWTSSASSERGQQGSTIRSNSDWTDIDDDKCNESMHLYCFQQ